MNINKIKDIFKKEDAAGLVLALMVLVVLAVLGIAVAGVTIGSHKLGDIGRDSSSAYYIAEAGANLAYEKMKNGAWNSYDNSSNSNGFYASFGDKVILYDTTIYKDVFTTQFGDDPEAEVEVDGPLPSADGEGDSYIIISIGRIGQASRTVKKEFTVKWVGKGGGLPRLPDNAVMIAKSDLDINRDVKIFGDVLRNGRFFIDRDFTHTDSFGNVHYDEKGMLTDPINITPYKDIFNSFPEFPNISTYRSNYENNTISENTYLNNLNSSNKLIFDTDNGTENGKTINLVVNKYTINGDIEVQGNGTVNIYVSGSLAFDKRDIKINWNGTADKFNIFYAGSPTVTLNRNLELKGTFFLNNAGIAFNRDLQMDGIIVSKKDVEFNRDCIVSGASIFAPYAKVVFNRDCVFSGTIVADKIESNRDVKFMYELNPYLTTYPYGPGSGAGQEGTLDSLISAGPALEP